ncbi:MULTISPECIES: ANTAR domain-containing protein [unclassified Amycolatopsis]|uniref:ANTAR domain-containing protein n=1 Tax=unclassified Amycolatopsis TaxID=2618356 RepID=UPI00210623A5|nr:ANTAR domain-containing protein [Amycolatopsis sp. DSM 110486]
MNLDSERVDQATKVKQLEDALATRPVIEQAKGMLMVLRTCSADDAFTALREISQHTNVKLHDVAAVVVAAGTRSTAAVPQETTAAVLVELKSAEIWSAERTAPR